jgi:hypothetical protein
VIEGEEEEEIEGEEEEEVQDVATNAAVASRVHMFEDSSSIASSSQDLASSMCTTNVLQHNVPDEDTLFSVTTEVASSSTTNHLSPHEVEVLLHLADIH